MQNKKLNKTAEQSARYPFIAEHRGGPLSAENHRRLIRWAIECIEHILPQINVEIDGKLKQALEVAREWEKGHLSTGAAMQASLSAHEVARQSKDPVCKALARAMGQTVATAHMADHSLGGAYYALKALKLAHRNFELERDWQIKRLNALPPDIVEIVQAMWRKKELDKRI